MDLCKQLELRVYIDGIGNQQKNSYNNSNYNIIINIMELLKIFGMAFFFIQYYFAIAIFFISNVLTFIWKTVIGINISKPRIDPFQVVHPYVFASLKEVISHEGFSVQTYQFQTKDCASISFWRIRLPDLEISKPYPILMMHGLLDCSASWFMHTNKSHSLPYMLASKGYDVWVGDNRGNRISMKEKDDSEYWEYTFDHLVEYDQPTLINKVLEQTGKPKLIYVGHSQGSTQFIMGLGIHKQLSEKIAAFIGLGTVASLNHVKSHTVLKILSNLYLLELCNIIGFKKILVLPKIVSRAVGVLTYNSTFYYQIMHKFIRLLCGYSIRNKISPEFFGVMITHQPGGASANNALQWVQCFRSGAMKKFDFGEQKNLQIYGTSQPPAYCLKHLKNLHFKSYLFKGSKDAVMSDQDFLELTHKFSPSKINVCHIPDYNHLDYVWSQTAHEDIYNHIISIIESHDQK